MSLKLLTGLGNPGSEYAKTPHNVGFRVLQRIAEEAVASWRVEPKLQGEIARIKFQWGDVILLRPQTYMNLSGESVAKVMHYYGVKVEDLVVVSDDADLPVGTIRIRPNGSDGGHRGLRSIISSIGTQSFARVRVGIGRSHQGGELRDFVLSHLGEEDEAKLAEAEAKAKSAAMEMLKSPISEVMNRFNGDSTKAKAVKQG